MDDVFIKMTQIADKTIKHYKTDFTEHDIITYGRMYEGTEFIWTVRKTGSYICGIPSAIMRKDEQYIKDVKDFSTTVIEHYKNVYGDKVLYFHVSKGKFIRKISAEKALEKVSA